MSLAKDRAANRHKRKESRGQTGDHEALLQSVLEEQDRRLRMKTSFNRVIEIRPLTQAQAEYDTFIREKIITFGVGPAGTGKTWLAAIRAAEALQNGEIQKIIITRPAVEAGEELGFLPGELEEKIEPYFRPVRDALAERLGAGPLDYFIKSGVIEARPLAYLRGATFKNCWVILDEAQNTTPTQMKMFLTRIGENAKMIINGDLRQKDIHGMSGLEDALTRIKNLTRIGVMHFATKDIVRHGLCQEIVECYER
jgi:phosphate starvation-inducible PhoH-like protein